MGQARRENDSGLFWGCAAGALALHAALLLSTSGVRGGADLLPHLWLIERMGEVPALRNTYAPAYHVLGALLVPWIGAAAFTRLFAWSAIAALIAGFRALQRAAGLPQASAALFALSPYLLSLSYCTPKVEAAGYALALFGLALLLRGRPLPVVLVLGAAFWVHTAGALFLGLTGGILCLARRDRRGLAALAAGTALGVPLVAAHLRAGCTLAEALLFSEGDYLRARPFADLAMLDRVVLLASPIAVGLAGLGSGELWRRHRPLALACAAMVVLYANELWLAPFGRGTTLNLLRGLTVLAIPVAAAAGLALAARPRWLPWLVGACALWAVASAVWVVPRSCFVRPVAASELRGLSVDRCTFRWRGPHIHRDRSLRPAPDRSQQGRSSGELREPGDGPRGGARDLSYRQDRPQVHKRNQRTVPAVC